MGKVASEDGLAVWLLDTGPARWDDGLVVGFGVGSAFNRGERRVSAKDLGELGVLWVVRGVILLRKGWRAIAVLSV